MHRNIFVVEILFIEILFTEIFVDSGSSSGSGRGGSFDVEQQISLEHA